MGVCGAGDVLACFRAAGKYLRIFLTAHVDPCTTLPVTDGGNHYFSNLIPPFSHSSRTVFKNADVDDDAKPPPPDKTSELKAW